jgi:hypothetical protein
VAARPAAARRRPRRGAACAGALVPPPAAATPPPAAASPPPPSEPSPARGWTRTQLLAFAGTYVGYATCYLARALRRHALPAPPRAACVLLSEPSHFSRLL